MYFLFIYKNKKMADLTNMLSDNPNEEVEVEEDTST
jgi:hypothetical protein